MTGKADLYWQQYLATLPAADRTRSYVESFTFGFTADDASEIAVLVLDGIKNGLLFNCTHDTVLRFLPPYILTEGDADRAISGLTKVFRGAKRP